MCPGITPEAAAGQAGDSQAESSHQERGFLRRKAGSWEGSQVHRPGNESL